MVDRTARIIAVLSLGISVIFSLATLYYSYWRPPFMVVEIGRDLLIEQTTGLGPRFGLNSGFINQGAKGTILTFFSLSFDSPPQELDLNAMSKSLAEWKEHEGKFLPAPGSYELVGPVVVKGGDAASATLWFIPNKRFE